MKYKCFLVFLMAFNCFYAQEQEVGGIYRLDTRINALVPHPVSNKAFRSIFIGVYSISGSENIQLFHNFFVGLCGSNTLYKVPTNKAVASNGYRLSDLCQLNSAGLHIGYDFYFTQNRFLSTSISMGQVYAKFTAIEVIPNFPHDPIIDRFNAGYMQITLDHTWMVEDRFGIGFLISYTYLNHAFNPNDIALNQFKAFNPGDSNGAISHFEVGFNLYFGYVKKKK